MKLLVHAVGRMKTGPERQLVERYLDRADKAGRGLGLALSGVRELAESRAGSAGTRKDEEARDLLAGIDGGRVVALDEGGRTFASAAFAEWIARERDAGAGTVHFLIGGADGHGRAVLDRADLTLAFGPMTWPHQLARILLAEQIYRATTILSGHPYHRA